MAGVLSGSKDAVLEIAASSGRGAAVAALLETCWEGIAAGTPPATESS